MERKEKIVIMEDKAIKDFITDIYNMAIDANKAQISILNENNNMCNWVIGLSSAGAFFILSKITPIHTTNIWFLITLAFYFICLFTALIHRILSKKLYEKNNLIIIAYAIQKSEIINNINIIKKELLELKYKTVQLKFLDFKYISDNNDSMYLIRNEAINFYEKICDKSMVFLYIFFIFESICIFITFLSIM